MPVQTNICQLIQQVSLFQDLNESQLQEIGSLCQVGKYTKHQSVFSQGERAKGFYVVHSGKVKVFKLSLEGKEQILHVFGPKEPFGEVPVFAGDTFPASAECIEDSELLFFPLDKLYDAFAKNPALAMNMLSVLAKRLRMFTRLVEDLSLKELPTRLAAYIMHLQDEQKGASTVDLEISKGNLSKVLGTTQESLSRAFKRMTEAGIIVLDKRHVTILNDGALEDLAEGYTNLKDE
jgi:CRP/FNR family transcriptional regulator